MTEEKTVSFYNVLASSEDPIPSKDLQKTIKKIKNMNGKNGKAILYKKGYYKDEPRTLGRRVLGLLLKNFMYKRIPEFRGEGKILDIGCNNGLYLYLLKNIGWDVSEVEINAQAAQASNSLGVNCFCGDLEGAHYPDHSFDVVRLHHVLEHVRSPHQILLEIKRILKPGGVVYFEVPNQRSFSFYVFRHIWHGNQGHLYAFSPATLKRLCDKVGFKIEKSHTKAGAGKFCVDLETWIRHRKRFSRIVHPKIISNKIFKVMVIIPFCSILNVLGLGDNYGALLSLKPGI